MDAAETAGGPPGTGLRGSATRRSRYSSPARGDELLLIALLGVLLGIAATLVLADLLDGWSRRGSLPVERRAPVPRRTTAVVEVAG